MKKIIFLFLVIITLGFSSCEDNSLNTVLENGVYVGKFNTSIVAYEVINNQIKPLGYSFDLTGSVTLDDQSFVAKFPEEYSPKSIVCFKTSLNKDDYEAAVLNSDQEFLGLHYALNSNDITSLGNGGLLFAIKPAKTPGKMQVTIIRLSDSSRYQTEAVISTEVDAANNPEAHRKLTFTVPPKITNQDSEEWSMTLNPVTSYKWSNVFGLFVDGKMRFQIEVIDNGLK
jgi:hypothetical protein